MENTRKAIYCANEGCRWHTEKKGGTFELHSGKMYCPDCVEVMHMGEHLSATCKELWDFTTTHFNGSPIHVRSLGHLRQLEKQFGVSSHAANYEQRNWNTPPPEKRAPEIKFPW